MPWSKEKKKAYMKEWRIKNKDHIKEYEDNQDPVRRRKTQILSTWKGVGLVGDYEAIYEIYLKTENCMRCSIQLTIGDHRTTMKCMDHAHDTGEYRAVLCNGCNAGNILDTHARKDNILQEKYIGQHGRLYRFRYKRDSETFKTLEEAIKYKEQYLLLLLDVD
jgi:hypothetical protein